MTIEEAKKLATEQIKKIAEEIVSVQPMPNIDLSKVAEHPLWQSFVDKHLKPE